MDLILAVIATVYITLTGDYPGWAPWQEDSAQVAAIFDQRDAACLPSIWPDYPVPAHCKGN